MLRALLTHRVRGQALSELQVAIVIGAIVLAGFAFVFARTVAASSAVNTYAAGDAAVVALFKEAEDGAAAGQAVFSPAEDVGGNSNADFHAADFYQQDGVTHVGHFYEYCFKTSSSACPSSQAVGTLQRYTYLWSELPQHGGSGATAQSSAVTAFSGFSFRVLDTAAEYESASLDPYAYAYFAKYPPTFTSAKTYHWGYPGVTSSTNDLYVMTVTLSSGEKRSIAFGKHNIVFAQDAIYGSATPTPNPMCASSCPNAGVALSFQNPIAAAQSATVVESNYGTRSTTPPQVYTIAGCSGDADYSPASPITPASDGTGKATLSITPVKQVAPSGLSCTISATDNASQSVPITVSVGQTYTPSASGGGTVAVGATSTVVVSEQNYVSAPQVSFTLDSGRSSGGCTVTPTSAMMSSGSYTYSESFTVTFPKAGVLCSLVFDDTYGQYTSAVTTEEESDFKSWPANLAIGTSGWGFGTTSATLADNSPTRLLAQSLNRLLGGGVASAAGTQTCYAYAYSSGGTYPNGSADTSLGSTPEITISGLGTIGVASDGCEIFSTDGGVTWTPVGTPSSTVPYPVMITYEPGGSTGTFQVANSQYTTCTSGMWSKGSWFPNGGVGVAQAALESQGNSAGSCTVAFTDNQSTQTPTVDAGLVNVNVLEGCGSVGGSCTFDITWQPLISNCDPQLGGNGGWNESNESVTASPSGLGTLTDNGNGSYTFTRSASGTVTITAYEGYTLKSASGNPILPWNCKNQIKQLTSFTI